jgi:hypothetical protein
MEESRRVWMVGGGIDRRQGIEAHILSRVYGGERERERDKYTLENMDDFWENERSF